jgi:hypothetical protein
MTKSDVISTLGFIFGASVSLAAGAVAVPAVSAPYVTAAIVLCVLSALGIALLLRNPGHES